MNIKTGIAIPMMAAMNAPEDQPEQMAEEKRTVDAPNDIGGPSPKLSQPSRPQCTQAQASTGERGSE
jgi:hypothetical protein